MIKIAIADDHKMLAQGVANLLDEDQEIEVVGVFSSGAELLGFLESSPVDLVITDMNMPGMDGMALIQKLKKRKIKSKIIVLSMYDDEKIFKECVKQGVDAYVLKDADPDEFIYTIKEVMENRHLMSFQRVLKQMDNDQYDDAYKLKFKLSKREIDVLKLVIQGKTNKEIADILFLSVFTIETHRKHLHQKLGVSNSIELLNKAQEMKLS
ncbi:MAG TPA: response regulator transcription factor [Sphingobacteriaceae bacterium]|nr:response regulator transcription factor [Sphingobacteriaceae bacterium]